MDIAGTASWQRSGVQLFVLSEADVSEDYVRWLNDPHVNRYLESRFQLHTKDTTRAFVQSCRSDVDILFLGIRCLDLGGRHVGNIKLGPINRQHCFGEVGILVGDRGAWGRGIATRAIESLSSIASEDLGLRKLTAGCYASNIASQKAFSRAGFEIEGTRRAHFLLDGSPEDLVLMAKWLRD